VQDDLVLMVDAARTLSVRPASDSFVVHYRLWPSFNHCEVPYFDWYLVAETWPRDAPDRKRTSMAFLERVEGAVLGPDQYVGPVDVRVRSIDDGRATVEIVERRSLSRIPVHVPRVRVAVVNVSSS